MLSTGEKIAIGEAIPKPFISLADFQPYDKMLVAVGRDHSMNLGATYFLWRKSWIEIPTVVELYSVTSFDNKLLAVTEGGKIIELVKN